MSHRLEYRYRVGDVLTHIQTVTMVSQGPQLPKMGGRTEIETVTRVTGDSGDAYTLRLEMRMLKREGALDQGVPADLGEPVTMLVDRSGAMLSCDRPGLPTKVEAFPKLDVEAGTTWSSEDKANPGGPMSITYVVEAILPGPDGPRATIASQGGFQNIREGSKTTVQASQVFDLTLGYQVESTSVVRTVWEDGRTTDVVVENKLRERA